MKRARLIVSLITCFCALAVLCFGVYAALSVGFSLGGQIEYEVNNAFVEIETKVYKYNGGITDANEGAEIVEQLADKTLSQIESSKTSLSLESTSITIEKYSTLTNVGSSLNSIALKYGVEDSYAYFVVVNVKNLVSEFPVYAVINNVNPPQNSWYVDNSGQAKITSTDTNKNIVFGFGLHDIGVEVEEGSTFSYGIQCGKYEPSKGLTYTTNGDNTEVTEVTVSDIQDSVLIIPDQYGGKNVTAVSADFTGATSIVSVIFGENVTTTPDMSAFTNLVSVIFTGNNVTSMSNFDSCLKLTSIAVPSSVTSLNLSGCSSLASVTFKDGFAMTEFANGTFKNCTSLTSIQIPQTITGLTTELFSGCTNLYNVPIPETITKIEGSVFAETKYLETIQNLNNGVAVAADDTTEFVISVPTTVTSIDLTNVKSIAAYAFKDCTKIVDLLILTSLKYIGNYAFENWENTQTIYEPTMAEYVPTIETDAFTNCNAVRKKYTSPQDITYTTDGSAVQNTQYNFSLSAQEITLPETTKDGYLLTGWEITTNTTPESSVSENKLLIAAKAQGNIEIRANFAVAYNISYNYDGGAVAADNPIQYGYNSNSQTITLTEPTKIGHTFAGWEITTNTTPASTVSGNTITLAQGAQNDIEIKALYTPNTYIISFDTDGGNALSAISYTYNAQTQTVTLPEPTKTDYGLKEWIFVTNTSPASTVSGNTLSIPANTLGNIKLKATYLSAAGYLSSSYLTKLQADVTDLTKENVKEIYFQTTKPTGYESMTATSVGANNETGTAYDGTVCFDVTAYTTAHADDGYIVYITSPYTIYAPKSLYRFFYQYTNLEILDFSNFNTSKTTNMSEMFYYCEKLKGLDLSNFDTKEVTNMMFMFAMCKGLTSLNVSKFDTSKVTNMAYMFWYCNSLTSLDVSNFDTSKVTGDSGTYSWKTGLSTMFANCSSLTSLDVSSFNTSNVITMECMFKDCSSLTSLDVSSFNTSKVTDMSYMFAGCSKLTSIDVSSFDVSKVTGYSAINSGLGEMFSGCSSLTTLDLSTWNTSNVVQMHGMFAYSGLQSINLSNFNTSNVIDMGSMFSGCSSLTSLYLSNFDTSNVTNMRYMFRDCSNLTSLDLSEFNTSKVTNMSSMFEGCSNLAKLEVTSFNTSQVTTMEDMFNNCSNLTSLDVSSFDMTKATNVSYMLYRTTNLTEIVLPYNVNDSYKIYLNKNFYNKDTGAGPYTQIDSTNCSTATVPVTLTTTFEISYDLDGGSVATDNPSTYTAGTSDQTITLTEPTKEGYNFEGWEIVTNTTTACSITDNTLTIPANAAGNIALKAVFLLPQGYLSSSYLTKLQADVTDLTKENVKEIYFQTTAPDGYQSMTSTSVGANNEGTSSSNSQQAYDGTVCYDVTAYTTAHTDGGYIVYITCPYTIYAPQNCYELFYNYTALTTLNLANFNTSKVTNMQEMFYKCSGLTSLDVTNFDTSKVTNMLYMFGSCSSLTSLDVSNFNTSNVTDMSCMFYNCKLLTSLDVSKFDTGNVTSMSSMFNGCSSLTSLDVSKFDTGNVTSMGYMFNECYKLDGLDVSEFNTSKVTNMGWMFRSCESLTNLDVSNFDTSKVTDTYLMFMSCKKLTSLDVSGFETGNVTTMFGMFSGCSGLTSLDVSNFDTSKVTNMASMFNGCSGLTSLDVSNFDTSSVKTHTNNTSFGIKDMFRDCSNLTSLDVSKFDVSNVADISNMFCNCSSLTSINLSNFNTCNVTNMSYMFYNCSNLTTLDLSSFDTSQVTNMLYMFQGCSNLTNLDVTSFNTSQVTTMFCMFSHCNNLTNLDVSKFNTSNVTNMQCMFYYCSSLTSLDVSNFDMTNVTSVLSMLYGTTNLTEIVLPYNVSADYPIELYKNFYNKETGDGPYTQITSTNCSTADAAVTLTTTFEISYDLDGGSVATDNASTYTAGTSDQTITLTAPTKEGYNFTGWEIVTNTTIACSITDNTLTIPANAAGKLELKAVYTAL